MKFILTPQHIKPSILADSVANLRSQLRWDWLFKDQPENPDYIKSLHIKSTRKAPRAHEAIETFVDRVHEDLCNQIHNKKIRIFNTNYTHHELRELKDIASSPAIVLRPADKNQGLLMMDTADYIKKMNNELYAGWPPEARDCEEPWMYDLLGDVENPPPYRPINAETAATRIDEAKSSINHWLLNYKSFLATSHTNFIRNNINLSRIPIIYGMGKIHKGLGAHFKMRCIVPNISTPTTNLSKFVSHYLNIAVNQCCTVLPNTISLILHLDTLEIPDDAFLCTADVTALYPSIPQDEGVTKVMKTLTRMQTQLGWADWLLKALERAMHIILKHNVFSFNGIHFIQQIGTAMGSAFAPAFANLYMFEVEREYALSCNHILTYFRYIDDIFAIVSKQHEHHFHAVLNQLAPNLVFTTCVHPTEVVMLDLLIFRIPNSPKLGYRIYQKPISKYHYIPFTSEHPTATLNGFIRGELIRYAINSCTEHYFMKTRALFFQRLQQRGYPFQYLLDIFNATSYNERLRILEKASTKAIYSIGKPIILKLPYTRAMPVIKPGKILYEHWSKAKLKLGGYSANKKCLLVYTTGRNTYSIIRAMQRRVNPLL
jgi:hypothetical protein